MGFVRQKKVYRLVFQDEEYNGLGVRATGVPLGQFLEMSELAIRAKQSPDEANSSAKALIDNFAGALQDWNLENEDGTPVPATAEGLYSLDFEFVLTLITAWMEAIAKVPDPLAQTSSAGARSLEASLPME